MCCKMTMILVVFMSFSGPFTLENGILCLSGVFKGCTTGRCPLHSTNEVVEVYCVSEPSISDRSPIFVSENSKQRFFQNVQSYVQKNVRHGI